MRSTLRRRGPHGRTSSRSLVFWRLATVGWMVWILVECWSPRPPVTVSAKDWVGHAAGFAVLGGLLVLAAGASRRRQVVLVASVVAVVWAVISEVGQAFVPGRSVSLTDWLADVFGGSLGLIATWSGLAIINARREG